MKFRNYVPHDKELQEGKLAPAVLPKFEDPVAAAPPPDTKEVTLYMCSRVYVCIVCIFINCYVEFILILVLVALLGSVSEHCSEETELGPAEGCAEEA